MELTVDIEYTVSQGGAAVAGHDRAKLSDEHPTSSYRIPVLVWRGQPHGIADLPPDAKIKVVWKKARVGPVWSLIQKAIDVSELPVGPVIGLTVVLKHDLLATNKWRGKYDSN